MGLLLTIIAGLVLWIVLWAIGVKGFDSFMLAVGDDHRRRRGPHHLAAPPGQPGPRPALVTAPSAHRAVRRTRRSAEFAGIFFAT